MKTGNLPTAADFSTDVLLGDRSAFDSMGYLEFFRNARLNSGIYVLPAGAKDTQSPHDEDEIYYVLRGRGRLHVEGESGAEDFPAHPGSILFVARDVRHHFHSVEEELQLLVFFSAAK